MFFEECCSDAMDLRKLVFENESMLRDCDVLNGGVLISTKMHTGVIQLKPRRKGSKVSSECRRSQKNMKTVPEKFYFSTSVADITSSELNRKFKLNEQVNEKGRKQLTEIAMRTKEVRKILRPCTSEESEPSTELLNKRNIREKIENDREQSLEISKRSTLLTSTDILPVDPENIGKTGISQAENAKSRSKRSAARRALQKIGALKDYCRNGYISEAAYLKWPRCRSSIFSTGA